MPQRDKSCDSRWDFPEKEKRFYALRKQSLGDGVVCLGLDIKDRNWKRG